MEKYYELHLFEDFCDSYVLLFKEKEKALKMAKEHAKEKIIYGDCSPFSSNEEYIQNALENGSCSYFHLYEIQGSPFADD
jgi:hypothetical protein